MAYSSRWIWGWHTPWLYYPLPRTLQSAAYLQARLDRRVDWPRHTIGPSSTPRARFCSPRLTCSTLSKEQAPPTIDTLLGWRAPPHLQVTCITMHDSGLCNVMGCKHGHDVFEEAYTPSSQSRSTSIPKSINSQPFLRSCLSGATSKGEYRIFIELDGLHLRTS